MKQTQLQNQGKNPIMIHKIGRTCVTVTHTEAIQSVIGNSRLHHGTKTHTPKQNFKVLSETCDT